jgi:hypothetical protein
VLQAVFGSINSIANVENIKKALLHQMLLANKFLNRAKVEIKDPSLEIKWHFG